jgi:hypothetical protein
MSRYRYSGRTELGKALIRRRADAQCLRVHKHWYGAMYLMGYAVECKLKVRLIEKFEVDNLKQLEDKLQIKWKKTVDTGTHSIEYLFSFTDARARLVGPQGDQTYLKAFHLCRSWRTEWRYRPENGKENECAQFFEAVERFLRFMDQHI